jgi:predicted nucleic acid-binding protein
VSTANNLVFIDTNVLVYAHDQDAGPKHKIAITVLEKLWRAGTGVLTTQVLQEFYSVVTQKRPPRLSGAEARGHVAAYSEWCSMNTDPQLLVSASLLAERYQLQWWDALIVEGAMRSGATTLLSEDMRHGQKFGLLTVRNPFLEDD